MKEKFDICTAEKAMNAILDLGFQIKNIYTLWISPSEEAALDKMGYDPKRMVCVKCFDDKSIFAEVVISKPICVGLKDGGGKPYKLANSNIADIIAKLTELENLKQENKELLKMNQELLAKIEARVEAMERRRSKNA